MSIKCQNVIFLLENITIFSIVQDKHFRICKFNKNLFLYRIAVRKKEREIENFRPKKNK